MRIFRTLLEYLTLGVTIVGPMPNNILDGQIIDAVPVMANFNYIAAQVNANAQPASGGTAPNPLFCGTATGSANAITLTPSPPITSLVAGQILTFIASANIASGAATIAASALAASPMTNFDGTNPLAGEVWLNQLVQVIWNGSAYINMTNAPRKSGTFTPGVSFGGGTTGITYAFQSGGYRTVGNLFYFGLDVLLTAKGTSTGIAQITGFPFSVNQFPSGSGGTQVTASSKALTFSGYVTGAVTTTGTTIGLQQSTSGGAVTFLQDTAFANNTEIMIGGVLCLT